MDDQFKKIHPPDKPATIEQRNNFVKQKNEIVELNKKANAGEHTGVYQEIGEHLGTYYDNFYKCMAVFDEEERRAEEEVYTGDASLGKRALQRVLLRKQLEQMSIDLRELMVYQSPPELGALYTEVESMTKELGAQQKVLMVKEIEKARLRKRRMAHYHFEISVGIAAVIIVFVMMGMFMWIAHDAQRRWGGVTDTRYRDTLERVRKQEWFEHQKKLQEYELFLQQQKAEKQASESGN
jgi:hypothetical protein